MRKPRSKYTHFMGAHFVPSTTLSLLSFSTIKLILLNSHTCVLMFIMTPKKFGLAINARASNRARIRLNRTQLEFDLHVKKGFLFACSLNVRKSRII